MKNISNIKVVKTNIKDIYDTILHHIKSLSYPIDSFVEESFQKCLLYRFEYENTIIGYCGIKSEEMQFFYVCETYFKFAPKIFERLIHEKGIKSVFVMTQDVLLSSIIAEWDYEKEKCACWFTDSKNVNKVNFIENTIFRVAELNDSQKIRTIANDFFDDISCGFNSLEERIEANTIFLLEKNEDILGCGLIEKSSMVLNNVSIGMYVSKEHRNKGVARTLLLKLIEWSYNNSLNPVAGCWYYNTVSRKSLESAGMIATSIGYVAVLKGKEVLPLRTGNPPGELLD